jgi:hypothetical protein
MKDRLITAFIVLLFIIFLNKAQAQFIDQFDKSEIDVAWGVGTGDGDASISLVQHGEHGKIRVDALQDKLNIWWAIIRRQVPGMDMKKLIQPDFELRVEAKIKVSHAPRRVNLHFNHQRTTDFHSHLKEFYIDDTTQWHVISMTTKDFDVQLSDKINVQLALMDWGNEKYEIDLDYIKVDVVNIAAVGPDLGSPLQYHPDLPKVENFTNHVNFSQDALIDRMFPYMNFNNWGDAMDPFASNLLAVGQSRFAVLRTSFEGFEDKLANGIGLLEMHIHHLERSSDFKKDFGHARLVEIIGGDSDWTREKVTYSSLLQGKGENEVINGQMIIDVDLSESASGRIFFAIPPQVIQRLFNNKTKGLAILPLGAVSASFYSSEHKEENLHPTLHFNID